MDQIKKEFQIFENYKKENNVELIYLDSAASSLTPDTVINKMNEYYFNYRSNINRAVSKLATKSTLEFENDSSGRAVTWSPIKAIMERGRNFLI